jgi:hypothetical protein
MGGTRCKTGVVRRIPIRDVVITQFPLTIFAAFLARYSLWMVRDRVSGNVSSIVLPLTIVLSNQVDLVFSLAIRYPLPRRPPQRVSACVSACLRVWASGRLSWC